VHNKNNAMLPTDHCEPVLSCNLYVLSLIGGGSARWAHHWARGTLPGEGGGDTSRRSHLYIFNPKPPLSPVSARGSSQYYNCQRKWPMTINCGC